MVRLMYILDLAQLWNGILLLGMLYYDVQAAQLRIQIMSHLAMENLATKMVHLLLMEASRSKRNDSAY